MLLNEKYCQIYEWNNMNENIVDDKKLFHIIYNLWREYNNLIFNFFS